MGGISTAREALRAPFFIKKSFFMRALGLEACFYLFFIQNDIYPLGTNLMGVLYETHLTNAAFFWQKLMDCLPIID